MAGVTTNANPIRLTVDGYSNAAVTASQVLTEFVAPVRCEIGAITALAVTAGSGSGNTVLDVLLNGTTIWTTAANRPTLASASTGEFTTLKPDGTLALHPGDRLTLEVASIPATTGHARVMFSVALNLRG